MDELMQQMSEKFGEMVQAVIKKVIYVDQTLPLELNQKQLATLLGCSTSRLPEFIYRKDFTKIDRGYGRRLAFPRDAVREWYNNNWHKL